MNINDNEHLLHLHWFNNSTQRIWKIRVEWNANEMNPNFQEMRVYAPYIFLAERYLGYIRVMIDE